MEKQGMGAGRKPNRTGLLMRVTLLLILFIISQAVFAQTGRQVIPALSPLPAPVDTTPEMPVFDAIWEGAPAQMTAGERAVFTLRITGRTGGQLPPEEFFMPEVPPGVILAPLPVSAEERAGGIVLKLNLIPLNADFYLPARVLQYENIRFGIPALRIGVSIRNKSN